MSAVQPTTRRCDQCPAPAPAGAVTAVVTDDQDDHDDQAPAVVVNVTVIRLVVEPAPKPHWTKRVLGVLGAVIGWRHR